MLNNIFIKKLTIRHISDTLYLLQSLRDTNVYQLLSTQQRELIQIIVSELCSNIIKYAKEGRIKITLKHKENNTLFFINTVDSGPGINNIEKAITRGYSTHNSLGLGLAIVNESLSNFKISNRRTGGSHLAGLLKINRGHTPRSNIRATSKKISQSSENHLKAEASISSYDLSVITSPCAGEIASADYPFVYKFPDHFIFGIFDAMGHGPSACEITYEFKKIMMILTDDFSGHREFQKMINDIDNYFHRKRSGALALALLENNSELQFSIVGNIAPVYRGQLEWSYIPNDGVLGDGSLKRHLHKTKISPKDTLIFHSDGLKAPKQSDIVAEGIYSSAARIAQRLHKKLAKPYDDSSILVLRYQSLW